MLLPDAFRQAHFGASRSSNFESQVATAKDLQVLHDKFLGFAVLQTAPEKTSARGIVKKIMRIAGHSKNMQEQSNIK